MLEKRRSLGVLHARMRQVEDELFRAEYSGENNPDPSDARDIPDYHVGTTAADVKVWGGAMARAWAMSASSRRRRRRGLLADPIPPVPPT